MSQKYGKVPDLLRLQSEVKVTLSNLVRVCFNMMGKNKAGDTV